MEKLFKYLIYGILMFCFILLCSNTIQVKNDSIRLYYDKCNHILLIHNFESARYIKKIELDLHQDTLVIGKVSRKLIPVFQKKKWLMTECAVKLQPTVKSVRYGDSVLYLSDMEEYSHLELIGEKYRVTTVFPKEFPCVIP